MVTFQQPPILRGNDTEKIARIHAYLYQISRDLTSALNNLTEDNFSANSAAAKVLSGSELAPKQALESGVNTLRSLIVKTADIVRAEMDVIATELNGQYTAISDEFGTLREDVNTSIEMTAKGLTQEIELQSQTISEFGVYVSDTKGYIRQGVIGYDSESGDPIIGIAIGQNLQTTEEKVTVGGKTYDVINTLSSMSTWTTEKLTFFVEGIEAAYFSNGALHAGVVVVDEKIVLGQTKWHIDNAKGFTIKWIGG